VSDLIAAALSRDTTASWLAALPAQDGPSGWFAPVLTLEELLASPEFAALEMTQEVERSALEPDGVPVTLTTTRSPIRVDGEILRHRRGAPRLGEHGILRDGADPLGGDPHGR
jgi:CoA:oxalate CoA-transferase